MRVYLTDYYPCRNAKDGKTMTLSTSLIQRLCIESVVIQQFRTLQKIHAAAQVEFRRNANTNMKI
jgi:hypothetical protein